MRRASSVGLLTALYALIPVAASTQGNPYEGDAAAVRAGRVLYEGRCADCHGADGKGNRGPDLTLLWAAGADDDSVFGSIREGVDGSIMPPSTAPDAELWAIVAYLRDIGTVPPLESSGNAENGRAIFESRCACCHGLSHRGGTLGPDLARVASLRSREALVRAVREPSAVVAEGFRAVSFVTGRGEPVEGVVKRRDAFSIQILTEDGRLQGFRLAELTDLSEGIESPMPAFAPARLSERELEDVLAFLAAAAETAAAEAAAP